MKMSPVLILVVVSCLAASGETVDDGCWLCRQCSCETENEWELGLVNCSSRDLTSTFPAADNWPASLQTGHSVRADRQQVVVQALVSLARNRITVVKKFPKLLGVERLSLAHNAIQDIQTQAFSLLGRLQHLDLSHNKLTAETIRPDVFHGPYNPAEYEPLAVVTLDLGYNDLHSLGKRAFEHLPHLTELRLSHNPFKVLDSATQAAIGSPAHIKVLVLASMGLSELPESFVHLQSIGGYLEELVLSDNNFTLVPSSLGSLGNSLRVLNLNGNPLKELDDNSFLGLHRLQHLSVSGLPALTRVGPATFSEQDSLLTLECSHNPRLDDIDGEAFRELVDRWPLKELHLHDNALTWLPEKLVPWNKLETINIQGNPWKCDCKMTWITKKLIPIIESRDEEHVRELHCSQPLWLSGFSVQSLSRQPEGGAATLCSTLPPPGHDEHMDAIRRKSHRLQPGVVVLLSMAIAMCVMAGAVALFVCYRQLRKVTPVVLENVAYRRVPLEKY